MALLNQAKDISNYGTLGTTIYQMEGFQGSILYVGWFGKFSG